MFLETIGSGRAKGMHLPCPPRYIQLAAHTLEAEQRLTGLVNLERVLAASGQPRCHAQQQRTRRALNLAADVAPRRRFRRDVAAGAGRGGVAGAGACTRAAADVDELQLLRRRAGREAQRQQAGRGR